jgi:hypothetical protein
MRSEGLMPAPLDEARIQMLRAGGGMVLLIAETYNYYRDQGIEPQTLASISTRKN